MIYKKMSKKCQYKFIIGSKKGQICDRFCRGNGDLCYAHKKFDKPQEQTEIPKSEPIDIKNEAVHHISKELSKPPPKKEKVIQLKISKSPSCSSSSSDTDSSDFSDSSDFTVSSD